MRRDHDSNVFQHLTDYPSIGQVNYLARKHNVHVIWAVTEDKFRLYSELAKLVEGSGREKESAGLLVILVVLQNGNVKELSGKLPVT